MYMHLNIYVIYIHKKMYTHIYTYIHNVKRMYTHLHTYIQFKNAVARHNTAHKVESLVCAFVCTCESHNALVSS